MACYYSMFCIQTHLSPLELSYQPYMGISKCVVSSKHMVVHRCNSHAVKSHTRVSLSTYQPRQPANLILHNIKIKQVISSTYYITVCILILVVRVTPIVSHPREHIDSYRVSIFCKCVVTPSVSYWVKPFKDF